MRQGNNNLFIDNFNRDVNWKISTLKNPLSIIESTKLMDIDSIVDKDYSTKSKNKDVKEINDKQKQNLKKILNNMFGGKVDEDESINSDADSCDSPSVNNDEPKQSLSQFLNNRFNKKVVDNSLSKKDNLEVGSVLLENFPSRRRGEKSFFSQIINTERPSFTGKRHLYNISDSFRSLGNGNIDPMDMTMKSRVIDPLDRSNTSISSNMSQQRVKHAMIDSTQLEHFKKCTKPSLNTTSNLVRENPQNIKKLGNDHEWSVSKSYDMTGDKLPINNTFFRTKYSYNYL